MSMKIGRGRGKKGDGLAINRKTGTRTRLAVRNASMFSAEKVQEMLNDKNTRAKDLVKLRKIVTQKGWFIA